MGKSAAGKARKKFSYFDVLKNLFPWKGDPVREVIRKIIFLIAVIVFGVCAFLVFDYFYENYKNNQMNKEIQKNVPNLSELADLIDNDVTNKVSSTEMLSYMKEIIAQTGNNDIVGHIQIPDKNGDCSDTKVNYPIVQSSNEADRDYYLERNIYKQEARAGSIYLDYNCKLGALERSDNLIIYGHEMQDGSMFGNLSEYDHNYSFYGNHPCIELSSRYDVSTYKIFGFFYADGGRGECDFYYTQTTEFEDEKTFYDYVNQIKRRSLVLNEVDVKYGDELLILSTCSTDYFNDARFVVAARKLRDGEDKYSGTENNSRNPNPLMPLEWYKARGEKNTYVDDGFVPYG